MTGYTGQNQSGSRVNYPCANRMGKLPLGLVTFAAHSIAVAFQHGQMVRTMHQVTVRARAGVGMAVQLVHIVSESIAMALAANLIELTLK